MKSFKEFLSEMPIKTGYHGSDRDIENRQFDIGRTSHNNLGFLGNVETKRHGAFFSNNPKFASVYGKVSKHKLKVNKTYDMDKNDYTGEIEHKFDPHGPDRDTWVHLKHGVKHAWQMFDGEIGKHFTDHLKSNGYDSAKFTEYIEDENGKEHKGTTTVMLHTDRIR